MGGRKQQRKAAIGDLAISCRTLKAIGDQLQLINRDLARAAPADLVDDLATRNGD